MGDNLSDAVKKLVTEAKEAEKDEVKIATKDLQQKKGREIFLIGISMDGDGDCRGPVASRKVAVDTSHQRPSRWDIVLSMPPLPPSPKDPHLRVHT